MSHIPVLLNESIEALAIKPNGIYIDCTFGRGGHSNLLLSKLDANGRLICLDRDLQAIEQARQLFAADNRVTIIHSSFANLPSIVEHLGLVGKVDGVLADLGISSPQVDEARRGFSFMQDGPLDMRMDTTQGISAAEWINSASSSEIALILKKYGEEKLANKIADNIVKAREKAEFSSTLQLARCVEQSFPVKLKFKLGKHPATRTFQAIRIFINDELGQLKRLLQDILINLKEDGRLSVITFHSLEDRIVKQFMQSLVRDNFPKKLPVLSKQLAVKVKLLRKISPSTDEIKANPRARSAILRTAIKLSA